MIHFLVFTFCLHFSLLFVLVYLYLETAVKYLHPPVGSMHVYTHLNQANLMSGAIDLKGLMLDTWFPSNK